MPPPAYGSAAPTAGAVYEASVPVTTAGSEDVQVIAAPFAEPLTARGRFSVVRCASTRASRSAETLGAFTTTSSVIVVPSVVVAVSVTGVSDVIERETAPVVETTEGFELAHVRPIPLEDAGSVSLLVTWSSAGLAPRTVGVMSRRMMPSVDAAFWAAVGMLEV